MNRVNTRKPSVQKTQPVVDIHGGLGVVPLYLLTPPLASDEVAEKKLGVLATTRRGQSETKRQQSIVTEEQLNEIFSNFWSNAG